MAELSTDNDAPEDSFSDYIGGGFDGDFTGSGEAADDGVSLIDDPKDDVIDEVVDGEVESPVAAEKEDEETPKEKALRLQLEANQAREEKLIAALTARQTQPAPVQAQEAVDELSDYEDPTDDDWHDDPTEAARRVSLRQQEIANRDARIAKKNQDREAAVINAQNTAWQATLNMHSEFGTDKVLRDRMAKHFGNPDTGLKASPLGTYYAAAAAFFETHAPKLSAQAKETSKTFEDGVSSEQSRQSKVKKAVMHGSGTGGGKAGVTLSPLQKETARKLGISETSYAEALKMMGL